MRGSLRRRDQRHTPDGPQRWELRVYLGRDKSGRAKQSTRSFAGTKREAESALAAFVSEIERGRRARTSRALFADYARQWLESRRRGKELAVKSLERYEGIIRDHFLPHLGQLRISAIGTPEIREALAEWRTGRRADGKPGVLSSKSVSTHFALLRQIFADALRDGLLVDNPALRLRAPKKSSRERRTYSLEQVIDLYEYLKPGRLAVPALTKALTGLRRGELLALRWKNVDFDRGIAYVHESVMVDRSGNVSFKAPKTDKSRRPVALPRALISILEAHKHQQEDVRKLLGLDPAGDLVFSDVDGSVWNPDSFSGLFTRSILKSKLPRISLHELRHSYASISQRLGTPLTTTSRSLGHSTVLLTADVYSHALIEDFVVAAGRLDAAFVKALPGGAGAPSATNK
jgi:integrase